jgi:hypothetical protein
MTFNSRDATGEPAGGPKKISMNITESMGIGTGTLTFDGKQIFLDSIRSDGRGWLSMPYSEIEYCSFIDNRDCRGVVVSGRHMDGSGLGCSMWILIQRKREDTRRGYVVHPEYSAEFFEAAKVFGKYCSR